MAYYDFHAAAPSLALRDIMAEADETSGIVEELCAIGEEACKEAYAELAAFIAADVAKVNGDIARTCLARLTMERSEQRHLGSR